MSDWPALPLDEWRETRDTLHRWTQIVGKIRLALTPLVNHWWNVTLYVTARGLTTSKMTCHDGRALDIEFDFIAHQLRFRVSDGSEHDIPLAPRSVADLYRETFAVLRQLDVRCTISPQTSEIPGETRPLDEDHDHRHYDHDAVNRFWRILSLSDDVFGEFRSRFIGKCSPVHFFWGSFDLAVTRFSGRPAPPRDGPAFMRDAYSHEVISHGFWPGSGPILEPSFYAYAVPEPAGLKDATVRPDAAYYHRDMGEFILPYDAVRTAASPEREILAFVESTYERASTLAGWDRAALEQRSAAPHARHAGA